MILQPKPLNWHRYEVKYLISEAQAAEIRCFCRLHLPADPHTRESAGAEYPVISTYLDSPARTLLRQTLAKQTNRYKLRIRTYRHWNDCMDAETAFCEIKRRVNGVVFKTRARVARQALRNLTWSDMALFDDALWTDPRSRDNANEFQQLRGSIHAGPVVAVYYRREAYEGLSAERIRITFDRDLHFGLVAPPAAGRRDAWFPVNAGGVILEIKFTNSYPFWVANMLHRLEIMRRGVCKYVLCSQSAGVCAAAPTGETANGCIR